MTQVCFSIGLGFFTFMDCEASFELETKAFDAARHRLALLYSSGSQ